MKLTDEDVKRMRNALIDASPLSDRMKEIVKDRHDISIIHRDVVEELAHSLSTDYVEFASSRLTNLLDILEGD